MREVRIFRHLQSGRRPTHGPAGLLKLAAVGAFAIGMAMLILVSALGERDTTAATAQTYKLDLPKGFQSSAGHCRIRVIFLRLQPSRSRTTRTPRI
jgi:hypothetical protein